MPPVTDHDDHWTWDAPGARAVLTSREGGVGPAPWDSLNVGLHVGDDPARVHANRTIVARMVELDESQVAGTTQVHGADVWVDLGAEDDDDGVLPEAVRWDRAVPGAVEADALVSTRRGIALAVGVADCLPIAIAWGPAVAAVHAGWRSLHAGVVEQALRVLRRAAGSAVATSSPHAVIGPALGACCMQVGADVAALFDPASVVGTHLDARADAERRLVAAGAVVEHVDVCTRCDPRCFSHRGDGGATGRQALVVRRT